MRLFTLCMVLFLVVSIQVQGFQGSIFESIIPFAENAIPSYYSHFVVEEFHESGFDVTEYRLWRSMDGITYRLRNDQTKPDVRHIMKGVPTPSMELFLRKHDLVIKAVENILGRITYHTHIVDSTSGQLLREVWIDETTGHILGSKRYDQNGNLATRTLYLDFQPYPSLDDVDFTEVSVVYGSVYEPVSQTHLESLLKGLTLPSNPSDEYELLDVVQRTVWTPRSSFFTNYPEQYVVFYHNGRDSIQVLIYIQNNNPLTLHHSQFSARLGEDWLYHEDRHVVIGLFAPYMSADEKLELLWALMP